MKILQFVGSILGIFTGSSSGSNDAAYKQIIAEREAQIKKMRYTIWILIISVVTLGLVLIFRKKK